MWVKKPWRATLNLEVSGRLVTNLSQCRHFNFENLSCIRWWEIILCLACRQQVKFAPQQLRSFPCHPMGASPRYYKTLIICVLWTTQILYDGFSQSLVVNLGDDGFIEKYQFQARHNHWINHHGFEWLRLRWRLRSWTATWHCGTMLMSNVSWRITTSPTFRYSPQKSPNYTHLYKLK